jgi:hypothetical protein
LIKKVTEKIKALQNSYDFAQSLRRKRKKLALRYFKRLTPFLMELGSNTFSLAPPSRQQNRDFCKADPASRIRTGHFCYFPTFSIGKKA